MHLGCPDQASSGHKRRGLGRRGAPPQPAPRAQPAVSVSVSVEETSSSKTGYEGLMRCLESPATANCKKDKRLTAMLKTAALGRRQLQRAKAQPVCKHGGTAVTCDDGLLNGDELMVDCGGSCEPRGAADAAQCAGAGLAIARALNSGKTGRFNINTPYNLTKPAGARCIMPPRSAQIVHTVIGMAVTVRSCVLNHHHGYKTYFPDVYCSFPMC